MTRIPNQKEAVQEFFEAFEQAWKNLNLDVRKFSAEALYQYLSNKEDRDEDEELIFTVIKQTRICDKDIQDKIDKRLEVFENTDFRAFITRPLYFDWNGQPIEQWEYSFKHAYFPVHVGKDMINGYLVSTVWLGLNHSWSGGVIIFETMIFKEDNSLSENEDLDSFQERYSTYEQALDGHKEACKLVRSLCKS